MSRILIAEDEPSLRNLLLLELTDAGQDVQAAINGHEALELLHKEPFDLLLLDLIMPRMDGYEVLRKMKDKGFPCPVVVMTNISDAQEAEKCRALGAVDFFVKSQLDTEQLWAIVSKHLSGSSQK